MLDLTSADDFDWGELGERWWRANQEFAGASEIQLRFAAALKGLDGNQKEAARAAGYAGDETTLKQAGYAAARSKAVRKLLDLYEMREEVGAPVDRAELRKIYATIIRTGTAGEKLKAGDALLALDRLDREEGGASEHPAVMLQQIAKLMESIMDRRGPDPRDRIILERLAELCGLRWPLEQAA